MILSRLLSRTSIALLSVAVIAAAPPREMTAARARAAALQPEREPQALSRAFDSLYYESKWNCKKPTPEGFVVAEVLSDGKVGRVWIEPVDVVTTCIRDHLLGADSKHPPEKPVLLVRTLQDTSLSQDDLYSIRESLLDGTANDHDDPSTLLYAGDPLAIPALIAVLRRNPADPGGGMVCTRAHVLEWLSELTGQNFLGTEEWATWWEENQTAYLNGEIVAPHGPTPEAFRKAREYLAKIASTPTK